MSRESIGEALALVNACLNGTSALLILAGRLAIAKKNRQLHRKLMVSAFLVSAIFLVSYLTRVGLTGTHRDPHVGVIHYTYLTILVTHMALAVAVVPMVLTSLYFATKDKLAQHRRIARITFPVWLYVSVTGVVVYVLLYVVPA
jgi:putative membrane protein